MDKENNDVFVSFSSKDYDTVKKIVETLIEKYGLKVWMCSKELLGGTQYFSIIPGVIRNSKVFLFIQSKNALESIEIPSEILAARNARKVIIPFLIDDSDIEDTDIEYFMLPLQYIDGTIPTLEKRIDELSISIYNAISLLGDASYLNIKFKERLISSRTIFASNTFIGRSEVIKEIQDRYDEGHNIVFLSGIGGIGKTQVAKKYVETYRDKYDVVIYVTYEGDIKSLIINESNFITDPVTSRKLKANNELENDEEFYHRKLKHIKDLSNDRTLIIIDNFDVEYNNEFEELFDGPYKLLITTRVDYSKTNYPQINIEPLNKEEDLKALYFNNYDNNIVKYDDSRLMELIKLVNYHTYTIVLLAKHMDMSLKTVNEVIEALNKEGIKSLNEEIRDESNNTTTAYNNLLKMYNLSSLNEVEIDALRFMLFSSVEGIPPIYIKMWGGSEIYKSVRELERRSWVIRTNNGYALHPIVYEIVKNKVKVDYISCKPFLDKYDSYITMESSWNFSKIEKEIYASFSYKFMEFFPNITSEVEDLYYDIECLLSFKTNIKKSLDLSIKIYDYFLNKVGIEDYYTIRSMYKVGWNYIFNKELPNSLFNAKKWIVDSFNGFQKITRPLSTYEKMVYYNSYRHIAKIYQFIYQKDHREEDYELAIKYAKESVDKLLLETDEEVKISRLPSMYIQVSDVYLAHKEYSEALKYEILSENSYGREDDDLLYRLTRKAMCYNGLNRFNEALEIANKCLLGFIEKDGRYSSTTLETYYILLDSYKGLNNLDKIKEIETEIANIRKVLFMLDSRNRNN